jgi:2-haloacid dehalogenase
MSDLRPKYITFDCYGTLTHFRMDQIAREVFAGRVAAGEMQAFNLDFTSYRRDEVLGAWKPYSDVICNSVRRTCKKWAIEYSEADGARIYQAIPTWGPHPDVPEPLSRIAKRYPLVILSNAANDQINSNVEKLGAPFHAVYTAEQAQSYKPRMQGFEYMLNQLGCGPGDLLHVSASLRYDLMTAHDMGIKHKVYVNRGYEPSTPYYDYHEVTDIGGLSKLLGI